MFFCMAMWSLCWLVCVFFHRASSGSAASSLVVLLLFFGFFGVRGGSASSSVKSLTCLSAPLCFGHGVETLLTLEAHGTGVDAHTADTHIDSLMSFNQIMGMLALDFWLYLALAWYFSHVLPTEFGVRKHPLFFLNKKYWQGTTSDTASAKDSPLSSASPRSISVHGVGHSAAGAAVSSAPARGSPFEPVSAAHGTLGVRISNLRKEFSVSGQPLQVAVNGLNLDLYEGQLNVLLGHNGAGSAH